MAESLAERLGLLEEKLAALRLAGDSTAEGAYGKVLCGAIATTDTRIEVESLKCLGDLRLQKGRVSKDVDEFGRATALFAAALIRCHGCSCNDPDMAETIRHRLRYAAKLAKCKHDSNGQVQISGSASPANDIARVAEVCLKLDRTYAGNPAGLLEEYTKVLVDSIADGDALLEVEVLKTLADFLLEEGDMRCGVPQLLKADAIYKNALVKCKDTDSRQTLHHRLLYTERVIGTVKKRAKIQMRRHRQDPSGRLKTEATTTQDPEIMSTYREHQQKGRSALQIGDLDTAEQLFASALKLVHGSDAPHLQQEAECLRDLGDVYIEFGKVSKKGGDFTKAAALYNAAMARTLDKVFKRNLILATKKAEQLFLQRAVGIDCIASPYDLDLKHKEQLIEMREGIKRQLETIDQQCNPYEYAEDDPKIKEVEASRAAAISRLFKAMAEDRICFVKALNSECVDVLGPPKCKYAFIGLGSQATELVTPYSDLEFALLIEEGKASEENKQYFRNLTHYLHMKIINLGETMLPAIGVRSLNDFYSEDKGLDWFYDSVTPRGFAFDGPMPWASKTPLGRQATKTKPAIELIQTPKAMVQFQKLDIARSEGYHLSDILRSVCYMTGDRELVLEYSRMLAEELKASDIRDCVNNSFMTDDMKKFEAHELSARILHVKNEIYRFPSIAIQNIAFCSGIRSNSIWDIVEELQTRNVVSEENAHHLKVLLGISAELRLRAYVANGCQRDDFSALLPTSNGRVGITSPAVDPAVFYAPSRKMLYRYYYTAYPLRVIASKPESERQRKLLRVPLFESTPQVRGVFHMTLCDFKSAREELEVALKEQKSKNDSRDAGLLNILAEVCFHLGDHKRAITHYEEVLDIRKRLHGHDTAHPDIATSLNNMANVWCSMRHYGKAVSLYEQVLDMQKVLHGQDAVHADIASSLDNLGIAWRNLGDQMRAKRFFEQALQMRKRLHGQRAAHPHISSSLQNLGNVYTGLGDHRRAIHFYEELLKMDRTLYGRDTAHPNIALSLSNVGNALVSLGDYKTAISLYEQSLQIQKMVFGRHAARPDMVASLNNMGVACRKAGDFRKAVDYSEMALRMNRLIHGREANHPDIVSSLINIGNTWSSQGNYREAVSFHEKALEMNKILYGHDVAHAAIATTYNCLGKDWSNLEDDKKAVQCFEQALRINRVIHGHTAAHPDIVISLNNLGATHERLGDFENAAGFYEEALKMSKLIYGKDTDHPHVAKLLQSLSIVSQKLGHHKKAIHFQQEALKMMKRLYGHSICR